MRAELAYGKGKLGVEIPEGHHVEVIVPRHVQGCPDQAKTIRESLLSPIGSCSLRERVKTDDAVAIVFSDITRPTPNHLIIPALLAELHAAGVRADAITLFNATGTHRGNTREELIGMLGEKIVDGYRIVQNDARAVDAHTLVGRTSSGNEVKLNTAFLACSFKILTGFIEPHFFAGFSGGGKAVFPGMAHLDSVMRNHSAKNIDSPKANWGILDGNPLRIEINEAAGMARPDFLLNVTLNSLKEVTASFAGDWKEAYREGVGFVKRTALAKVDAAFDIVITSNSGYPLDGNLYQSVKGMSAAARVVKQGGAIIIATECSDGIPDHGSFGKLLSTAKDTGSLLTSIRNSSRAIDDQWQAQILAMIAEKAEIHVHCSGLTSEQLARVKLKPCPSIEAELERLLLRYGKGARICVLPEGPQTIPFFEGSEHDE